jgi:hypothetical protein
VGVGIKDTKPQGVFQTCGLYFSERKARDEKSLPTLN